MSRTIAPAHDKAKMDALAQLDLVKILRAYVGSMITAPAGYKGLVLDAETMRIVSMLYGRTELAEQNVVHVESIDGPDLKEHKELKASWGGGAVMRPSTESMDVRLRRSNSAAQALHCSSTWICHRSRLAGDGHQVACSCPCLSRCC